MCPNSYGPNHVISAKSKNIEGSSCKNLLPLSTQTMIDERLEFMTVVGLLSRDGAKIWFSRKLKNI